MDLLDESLLQFWRLMNQHAVRYIMVGGLAVNLHGYSRITADIDVWLEDTVQNRQQLGLVMDGMGYKGMNMVTFQFVPGWSSLHIGNGIRLDMMTKMVGIEATFTECIAMATQAEIEGITVPFLHINQLIANKKAVNRPKDQIDVAALEKIRELLRQQQGE
jgi:Nucleotidyl transferase of unknown function (DUF2204)